jgi:hypothetical protein
VSKITIANPVAACWALPSNAIAKATVHQICSSVKQTFAQKTKVLTQLSGECYTRARRIGRCLTYESRRPHDARKWGGWSSRYGVIRYTANSVPEQVRAA